jgi:hypothetical protein
MKAMNLISPTGTIIVATLERLTGRAIIVPGSVRQDCLGSFEFEYEGSTEIYWNDQQTVVRDDERVFVDRNGDEFLESELKLAPVEEEKPPEVITVRMEGGLIHSVAGIPRGVKLQVIDLDTEGAEPESLTNLPSGEKAYIQTWESETEIPP